MTKHPRYELRFTRAAQRDLVAVMGWSLQEFCENAALRYDAPLSQALVDIREDPGLPGVLQRPELAKGVVVYHLRFSRDRARPILGGVVHQPRHLVVFRQQAGVIEILRVLHDARELERHLPEELLARPR